MTSAVDKSLDKHDYLFRFSPITDDGSIVSVVDPENEYSVKISIDDHQFSDRLYKEVPFFIADLLDIAVAIYSADRLLLKNILQKINKIFVVLPIRSPHHFQDKQVLSQLYSLLYWMTGNYWEFEFIERSAPCRAFEHPTLIYESQSTNTNVILWSGGLDALAGLYNSLIDKTDSKFVLLGTGSSDYIHHKQKEIFDFLNMEYQKRLSLYRVPVRFSHSTDHLKNKISRARGILFLFVGSVCSYLLGQRTLNVYENGVGAINLPYTSASIGLDNSRSVHPITLFKVSSFISEVIKEPFDINNPYLFKTKAQMCESLASYDKKFWIERSVSCDSRHRRQPSQCGYCASCLLRRQAIAIAGISDNSKYVITHSEHAPQDPNLCLRHMLAQVDTMHDILSQRNSKDKEWRSLSKTYPVLDNVVDRIAEEGCSSPETIRSQLLDLYSQYVQEWKILEKALGSVPLASVLFPRLDHQSALLSAI